MSLSLRPFRIAAVVIASLVSTAAGAQPPQPAEAPAALPPILPESVEVAMALSAAPADVSRGAAVWVLRRGGFVKLRDGDAAGLTCLVQRDHPESLYPLCYDAEASRTILPIALETQRLREIGRSHADADREIAAAIAQGRFAVPSRLAVAYMLSPAQVIYGGPTGRRVGRWYPHVMLYSPNVSNAQLGLTPAMLRVISVQESGRPTAHVVVKVPEWSDGTAAKP